MGWDGNPGFLEEMNVRGRVNLHESREVIQGCHSR